MKAHIRKMPTKETYFKNLANIFDNIDTTTFSGAELASLENIRGQLGTEEYYNKMKEAFGGETREDGRATGNTHPECMDDSNKPVADNPDDIL